LTFWPVAWGETPAVGAGLWVGVAVLEAGAEAAGRWVAAAEAAVEAWVAVFAAPAGVTRGGATGVLRVPDSVRICEVSRAPETGAAGLAASSAVRGGASLSISRVEGGAGAGLRSGLLAFRDRRLMRGSSDPDLSKLNSVGSAVDSERAAGEGLSGMTPSQITPPNGNSKTFLVWSKDFSLSLLHLLT
jgi:hypothetical protein